MFDQYFALFDKVPFVGASLSQVPHSASTSFRLQILSMLVKISSLAPEGHFLE
jgi:hypothetical protein